MDDKINDISFYKFATQYIKIIGLSGQTFSFNEQQLINLKKMDKMINNNYELKLIHLRKGTSLQWVKKNKII
jgi:hypothetical protein